MMHDWSAKLRHLSVLSTLAWGLPGTTLAQVTALPPHVFEQVQAEGPWQARPPGTLSANEVKLMQLLVAGQSDQALALIKQQAPLVNFRDTAGNTPLTLAVSHGHLPLVRELLRRGAQRDQMGMGGHTPLGLAAYQGHDLLVRELLQAGANPRAVGITGQSPLHLACLAGQARVVALLLQTPGVDRMQFNQQGRHALAEAAYNGQLGVIQQLMAAGMRPDEPDQYRLNALHAAAMGGQVATWHYLLSLGVPVPHPLSPLLLEQVVQGVSPAP